MRHRSAASLIAAVAALLAAPGAAGALQATPIGDFDSPMSITSPPGDLHRLFVAERGGVVELLHDGVRKQFLALDPAEVLTDGEGGLLSMAFAPDYATSGLFYVYFTTPREGDPIGNVGTLAEYRRSEADPDSVDPGYRRILFTVDHPGHTTHDGGQLQFGPDGLLYLSTGDGGGPNDPNGNAQRTDVRLGKLLRIDPRQPDAVPELYALGLRNPWRFSFDRLTGDMIVGDVGQVEREEIDFAPKGTAAGQNFGWSCREGLIAGPRDCTGAFVDPVFEYDHSDGRCAIVGGYVVRNHDIDSVYGRYLYVDNCVGDVRSLVLAPGSATGDAPTGLVMKNAYTFGQDACGHVFLGTGAGHVYELLEDRFETPAPCPEPEKPPVKPPTKPPPAKDRTPPRLTVARRLRQHLEPHRSLYVTLSCSERCGVTAAAKVNVPGRAAPFKAVRSLPSLAAGRRVTIRLLLTPEAARAARRAIEAGNEVTARLRIVARDTAGNQAIKSRRVIVLR